MYFMNDMLNNMTDIVDKEKLWRNGKINFETENPGNNKDHKLNLGELSKS